MLKYLKAAPPLSILRNSQLKITSLEDAEGALKNAFDTLLEQASSVSPTHAIPTLLDAVVRCYYKAQLKSAVLPSVGPALKIAVAAIWPHIWDAPRAVDPESGLKGVVAAAQLVDQLQILRIAMLSFGASGTAWLKAEGSETQGDIHEALESLTRAFASRGQILRLAEETARTIQLNPMPVLKGIFRVLRGDAPKDVEELRRTWLCSVPSGENPDFWKGLAARLAMLILVAHLINETDPLLPVVFPESAVYFNFNSTEERELLRLSTSELFWLRDWHRNQPPNLYRNLLGERPVLRIGSKPDRFCTALLVVADSINWFVESSVGDYPGSSGIPLSSSCFKEIISLPFEATVQSVLAESGFRAGPVNDKGTWFPSNEPLSWFSLKWRSDVLR